MLDEKDVKILEILRRNARIPYTEIARQLGMSDVAVLKRIKRMEAQGIILRYTIEVNPRILGAGARSITGIDVEPTELFNVVEKLKRIPEIEYLAITSGDHSLIAFVRAPDSEQLAKVHELISSITGVKQVWPAIIVDEVKKNYNI
jgi:Lrp/AsnC family transcriptional regulator for asnA, asnC and gidA